MKTVTIVKQFVLTHNNMTRQQFAPGVYELEDDVASHPYVIQHSDKPESVAPMPGTVAATVAAVAQRARKELLAAAIAEASEEELKQAQEEHNQIARRRVISDAIKPPARET